MLVSKAFAPNQRANSTVEGPDRCVLRRRSRAFGPFESARRSRQTSTRHLDRAASSRRRSDHSRISDGIPRRSPGDRRSLERFSKTCVSQWRSHGYGASKPRREATLIASTWLATPSLANNAPRNGSMSAGEKPSIAPIWLVGAPCASSRRAYRSEGVIRKTGPLSVRRPTSGVDGDGKNSRL